MQYLLGCIERWDGSQNGALAQRILPQHVAEQGVAAHLLPVPFGCARRFLLSRVVHLGWGGGRARASHAWLRQQARLPQEGALRLQGEGFPGCRAGSASHCASRGSLTCAGWQSPAGAGATHKSAQCRKTRRIQHRCRLQGAAGREPPLGRVPGGALHLALQLRRSAPGPP